MPLDVLDDVELDLVAELDFLEETLPALVELVPPRGKEIVTSAVCFYVMVICFNVIVTLIESPDSLSSGNLRPCTTTFSHVSPFET